MTGIRRNHLGCWLILSVLAVSSGCQQGPTEKITMSGGSLGGGWSASSALYSRIGKCYAGPNEVRHDRG